MSNKDTLYDELCLSVYTTNRYFHHLYGEVLGDYDLSYLQYMSLLIVYKNKSAKLMDVGNALDLSSNTLTPVIDRLVSKKWLIKVPSEVDRRVKYLKISESKRLVFEQILLNIAIIRDELIATSTKPVSTIISENKVLNETLQKMILARKRENQLNG